jgi:hypothetical protein
VIDKVLKVIAATSVLALGGAGIASGTPTRSALKDCGRLAAGIGGTGKLPKGVPAGSTPQADAFRVSGSLSCSTVRSVMQVFENNATSLATINKPPAAGWSSCKFSAKAQGYVCRMGKNVIEDQLVWKKHGKTVGPGPRRP